MSMWSKSALMVLCGSMALPLISVDAGAAPGDVYRVTADKVNLRSGPSDETNIRSTVAEGDELIELRSEGGWLGVRVLDTGQEGWIFGDLVERVASTNLSGTASEAGFGRISPEFDRLLADVNERIGYRIVDSVEQADGDRLRVVPTSDWLFNASREAKLMTALAIYGMWKNYNNGRPVNVDILNREGESLLAVNDTSGGPELSLGSQLAME